jgi:hypothetical protein
VFEFQGANEKVQRAVQHRLGAARLSTWNPLRILAQSALSIIGSTERLMWHLVTEEWQLCTLISASRKHGDINILSVLRRLTIIRSYAGRLAADLATKHQ